MAISMATGLFSASTLTLRPNLQHKFSSPTPPSSLRMVPLRTVTRATVSQPPADGKSKARGIMKPKKISPEMQDLIGLPEVSRTQALKHIWAYIKGNNLQNPENKKVILCDEKLKKVFAGRDEVGMLEIAGLISPHFLK